MRLRTNCNASLGCVLIVLGSGCASTAPPVSLPPPRPLGAEYASPGRPERHEETGVPQQIEETGPLSLRRALALALMWNPELVASWHGVQAAEAQALQAGMLPNPELGVEVEEYDRAGDGSDSAETTLALGQLLELGGKRRWRMHLAQAEGELAGWDYEAKRLDVFAETARRFAEVVAAQNRVGLAAAAAELATETARAVEERVKAGKEPPLQAAKANAELELARIEADSSRNALRAARGGLAAMWAADEPRFETAAGDFERVADSIPGLECLRSHLSQSPELAWWEAEIRRREAALGSEKAERVPDVEAAIGWQRFEEDGTGAIALGVAIPLPVFDRNQGNITRAQYEISRAHAERTAAEASLKSRLNQAHAELLSAHGRVAALRSKVVPAMEQAFEAAREGYHQGKFGFLDMLDAQRGLFEARRSLVDALAHYHAARVEVERITGTSTEWLSEQRSESTS